MKTLLTGASGFVGASLLRKLLDAGHEVRALLRPDSDRRNLQGLDVECVDGDLRDPASLQRAMQGCNALFHVAADYRLWSRHPQELYESNVTGTRNIMQAALQTEVERIVYTSSVAVLGIHPDGTPSNEDSPVSLDDMIGDYKRSKFLAEQEVSRLIAHESLPAVIVNPSTPIGPRDIKPTPTGRIILDAATGRMPAFVDTGLNIAHVEDVAAGHLLAFTKGLIGERYILGGTDLSLREILQVVARLTDQKPPSIELPQAAVMPIAYLSEWWAWISNGPEPRATVAGVRMSKKKMFFSSEKARRELGYQSRPAEDALREAIDWFRANHYM